MGKTVVGLSLNVSAGRVIVNGKQVEARSSALAFGIDRWGTWRLTSIESGLSWWRRALINLAYWHPASRSEPIPETTYADGYDPLDYDDTECTQTGANS